MCILFVSGCSNAPEDSIQFSQFSFPSNTPVEKQIFWPTTKYTLPWQSVSGDSLIIVQDAVDVDTSYTGRLESNIADLTNQYPRLMLNTQDDASFSCKDENIPWSIAQWTLTSRSEDEDPLYLAQYFFIHNTDAFVLSFASLDVDATEKMVTYRNDITCQ